MARVGRRIGFAAGISCGISGALICAFAAHEERFWWLCVGSLVLGVYGAFGQYYRFAAADVSPPELRSRSISWVLAAGVLGAVIGPEGMKLAKDATNVPFVGAYLALVGLGVMALSVVFWLRIDARAKEKSSFSLASLLVLVKRPEIVLAMASAVVGYAVMLFLMTATPLAMAHHSHPFDDTAFVIEWHVLGMFAPSFVTGALIKRLGVLRIINAGAALMLACVFINQHGTTLTHFWSALVALGVGWNFMFVGGTTLLTEACRDDEQALAQGFNEVLVYVSNGAASLTAGILLFRLGWQALNGWALPFPILVMVGAVLVARARQNRASEASADLDR
jgi:predicted MFS family arabinose efflux permease